jgi:pyridoxamine 5'-phosphate oxidase
LLVSLLISIKNHIKWNENILSALRIKYKEKKDVFREDSIEKKDPIDLFGKWLDEATKTEEILEPNAMALATVNKWDWLIGFFVPIWTLISRHDRDGFPSNRYVLLKGFDSRGFTFFTNYASRKAEEMEANPNVAVAFYWLPLRRSIRIEGSVTKLSDQESEAYFHVRPRASQIGALASPQSQLIPSREHMDKIEDDIKQKLGDTDVVPMPNWGGYLISPRMVEFWQGQTNRLHDRIRFRKSDEAVDDKLVHRGENGWVYERLAP